MLYFVVYDCILMYTDVYYYIVVYMSIPWCIVLNIVASC